jgi:hypothetical protein
MKSEKECAPFQDLIVRRVNEPLEAGEDRALNEHLSRCSGCRQYLESLEESLAFFKDIEAPRVDLRAPAVSGSFLPLVRAILGYRVPVYQIAAAAAVFVFLVLGWVKFLEGADKNGITSVSYAQDDFSRRNSVVYASGGSLF